MLAFVLLAMLASAPQVQDPHQVTPAAGKALVDRYEASHTKVSAGTTEASKTTVAQPKSWRFASGSLARLAAQPGAASIHVHRGMREDGVETLVLVAVDATGAALPIVLDQSFPCPPCTPEYP